MNQDNFMRYAKLLTKTRRTDTGCLEWTGRRSPKGYGVTTIRSHDFRVHRLVWILLNGPIAPDRLVCHRCDNPPCIRPAHLFEGSALDNVRDKIAKGRAGAVGAPRTITALDLERTRDMRPADAAALLGVSRSGIYAARSRDRRALAATA